MAGDVTAERRSLSLRPAVWLGAAIIVVGVIIVGYAFVVYLQNRAAPVPSGMTAPLWPLDTLLLGVTILVIGLVIGLIAVRSKDVWPPEDVRHA
jgi:hypothetical protein